jgi:uncharacterized protein YegP (UPF0339 family)
MFFRVGRHHCRMTHLRGSTTEALSLFTRLPRRGVLRSSLLSSSKVIAITGSAFIGNSSPLGLMGTRLVCGREVTLVAEFEIYKDQDNPQDFRWRLRANNGEIIADSGEGYNDKDDCEHGIELVQTQSSTATVQDLT